MPKYALKSPQNFPSVPHNFTHSHKNFPIMKINFLWVQISINVSTHRNVFVAALDRHNFSFIPKYFGDKTYWPANQPFVIEQHTKSHQNGQQSSAKSSDRSKFACNSTRTGWARGLPEQSKHNFVIWQLTNFHNWSTNFNLTVNAVVLSASFWHKFTQRHRQLSHSSGFWD